MKKKRLEYYILVQFILIFSIISFFLILKLMGKLGLSGCTFFEITHLYCPGCGGTRAVGSLLRLDVISSFKYNAIVPVGFALFLYYDIRILISILKNDIRFLSENKYIPLLIFAIFLVAYFIVRNILLLAGIDFMTI